MAYTDGNIVIGTSVDMYGMNTGLKKIEKSVKKLQVSLGAALGIGVLSFGTVGKAALDSASDLQEVQNIVDVTFEDMNWKIEKFAETCIDKFGMSELAAKQTAGSFMAMGRSMGLTLEEASNMSVKLTALTGDFASFYNISQDYARVALSAVYTGETETLKRYGIILTQANLQEYASTLGIEKKVKAMSAREKLLLRYNYILQATNFIEGDFVRTQNSWANQTRILQQRWRQLLIVMGNGLVSVLTPMIKVINQIIASLIRFATIIGQVLSRLFGIKWRGISDEANQLGKSAEGAAGGVGDLGDAEDDLADATNAATKAAKKQLAPFDELNNLMDTTKDSTGGAADNLEGLADGLVDGLGDLADGGGITDFKIPDIFSLFDLGRWLSQKLAEMLENIDWDSIFEKARRFGTGLADFLNGLFTPRLFADVGRTIANALNTAIYAALAFGNRFNWENFGRSIAAGINEFFLTFDFASLAETINTWINGLLTTIIKVLDDTDWYMIGEKIGTLLAGIDWFGLLKKAGEALLKALGAIADVFTGMLNTAPLQTSVLGLTALITLMAGSKFQKAIKLGKAFFGVFTTTGKDLKRNSAILQNMSPALAGLAKGLDAIRVAWGTSGGSIGTFFGNLVDLMSPLAKGITAVTAVVAEMAVYFSTFKKIGKEIHEGVNAMDILNEHLGILLTTLGLVAAALTLIFGIPAGLIIAGVAAAVAAVAGLVVAFKQIDEGAIDTAFANVANSTDNATHSLSDYLDTFDTLSETVTLGIDEVNLAFENLDKSRDQVQQTSDKIGSIYLAMKSGRELTEGEIAELEEAFKGLNAQMSELVGGYYDTVIAQTKADYMYLESTGQVTDAVTQEYANRIQSLYEAKQGAIDEATVINEQEVTALQAYNDALHDVNATEEERNAARKAVNDAIVAGLETEAKYGVATADTQKEVAALTTEMQKFRGELDLSKYEISAVDDAQAAFESTLESMTNKYSDTSNELQALLEKQQSQLEQAQKNHDTVTATSLQNSIDITQDKLSTLKDTYSTELMYMQEDMTKFVPEMLKSLSEEWDKKSDVEKAFLPSEDQWLEQKMNEWVEKFYGDAGMKGAIQKAYAAMGEDSDGYAQQAAEDIVGNLFDHIVTELQGGAAARMQSQTTVLSSAGKDIVSGINDGITSSEAMGTVGDSIKQLSDEYINSFRTDMDSHSPAKVMIPEGKNIVAGVNKGIAEDQDTSKQYIKNWTDVIKKSIEDELTNTTTNFSKLSDTTTKTVATTANTTLTSTFTKINSFTTEVQQSVTKLYTDITTVWQPFSDWVNNYLISPTKLKFADFINYMRVSVINPFKNAWISAINTIKSQFVSLANTIKSTMRDAMNSTLSSIESGLNNMNDGFSKTAQNMKNISTGSTYIQHVSIPKLAKGAVIPPNQEFLAVLGDQKRGTNIEAPLDTIKQAVAETFAGMQYNNTDSGDIVIQIDGYEVFRAVRNQSERFRNSTGYGVL